MMRNLALITIAVVLSGCMTLNFDKYYLYTGYRVAIHEDTLVFGTGYADSSGGYLTVFERKEGKWNYVANFDASTIASDYRVPFSLDASNDLIVAGADAKRGEPGAVIVIKKDPKDGKWKFVSVIKPKDGEPNDLFGKDVSVDGKRFLVGAQKMGKNYEGTSYLYSAENDKVLQEKKFSYGDYKEKYLFFGTRNILKGNEIMISAENFTRLEHMTSDVTKKGLVRVYEKRNTEWEVQTEYDYAMFPAYDDGWASLNEEIGMDIEYLYVEFNFKIYIFHRENSEWELQYAIEEDPNWSLGISAISGNTLVLGVSYRPSNYYEVRVYREKNGVWNLTDTIQPKDVGEEYYYGFIHSLDISGDTLVIGSTGHEPTTPKYNKEIINPGTVYIIKLLPDQGYVLEDAIVRDYNKRNYVIFRSRDTITAK